MAKPVRLFLFMTLLIGSAGQASQTEPQVSPLIGIKSVCVENFAGDPELSETVKEIAIASLFALKRFQITERCDKANAVLKGAIIEKSGTKVRAEGEAAGFGVAAGAASATAAAIGAAAGGSEETLYSKESQRQAAVATRLVDTEGVIIWAHTQESAGGKVKSAIVDAMERALRQLARDVERAVAKTGT